MPCVTLLLQTQHTHLLEAALVLAHASDAASQPQDLAAFRALLVRHDRMERNVFQRLGAPSATHGLIQAFDRALAAQSGDGSSGVAEAARQIGRIIEDHANFQEDELFPALIERHDDSVRHTLGDHYARLPVHGAGLAMTAPVAA